MVNNALNELPPAESPELESEDTAEQQPVHDYVNQIPSIVRQKRSKRRALIIIMVVLGLVFISGGYLLTRVISKQDNEKQQPAAPTEQTVPTETIISDELTHYTSSKFFLEFDYPADWTLAEDDSGDSLSVTSPQLKLVDSSGSSVDGIIKLTIREPSEKFPEFDEGNAVAVVDSEKISYQKPSQVQRANTYVSFLGFGAKSTDIDGVFITGDFGYQKGQAIPRVDIKKIDPVVNLSFFICSESCDVPTQVPVSSWQSDEFGEKLKKILTSLRFN